MTVDTYRRSVFLNVPFDPDYMPLFDAMVFTVCDCGFYPRNAREQQDSGQIRVEKLFKLIDDSKYGIHDISRTDLDKVNRLPRFNMPFELGLFIGAHQWGSGRNRRKVTLVLDREPYRYQKFLSDIAGQDIRSHGNHQRALITVVRDWLSDNAPDMRMPGGASIFQRFVSFAKDLPAYCILNRLQPSELTFNDRLKLVAEWIEINQS